VVNTGALTNVDLAEREPDLARAVNDVAPTVMADAAREVGALIVHYSTDYVFDGAASTPYDERAEPNPINVYGATKLGGERGVAASDAPHLIIRTSWVYSAQGSGFVATLLRQLNESRPVRVVTDQVGSPTWSRSLADSTAALLRAVATPTGFEPAREDWGIYHLGGSGAASRFDIAQEVIAARESTRGASPVVIPISAVEFNAVAPRPQYSALSNQRAAERFGVRLDDWRVELRRMLANEPV
jgi:dTDP-4-dehydrorhamnose reductase